MKKKTWKQMEAEYDRTLESAGLMSKRKLMKLFATNDQVRQIILDTTNGNRNKSIHDKKGV